MLLETAIQLEKGALYVQERTRLVRMVGWPFPGAWAGGDRPSCRTPIDPPLGLADFERAARARGERPGRALTDFLATIPPAVRTAIAPLPEHMFLLLRLIWDARDPALELLQSNPALALAVALASKLKSTLGDEGWKTPVELVKMKRPKIVRWLEFPGGKSTVGLLARVTPPALFLRHLRTLRALLASEDPAVKKALSHVREINPEVLAILGDPALRRQVTPPLLDEVSEMRYFEPFYADKLRYLLEVHPIARAGQAVPVFQTLDEIERLSRELEPELKTLDALRRLRAVRVTLAAKAATAQRVDGLGSTLHFPRAQFPDPPFPGNDNIVPLETQEALLAESRAQKNCAGNYWSRVLSGAYYLYRMERPERCTISLARVYNSGWRLCEVKISCNREPQLPATMRVIKRWVSDHQIRAT